VTERQREREPSSTSNQGRVTERKGEIENDKEATRERENHASNTGVTKEESGGRGRE